ncbi:MAG: Mrp/NBP35 family ATP-binding protein [Magnetococcales bacterium]|nr:Mrp/NBP35 family ATP-binding protein [Magnetococcales bacterium]
MNEQQPGAANHEAFPLPVKQQIDHVRHVIAVSSAKGGVGKSTVATNLAFALQQLDYKVGLLDADIYGPSIPTLLGVSQRPEPDVMGRIKPVMAHKMPLMSIGFMVDAGQPLAWRGPMLFQVLQQFFHEVRWTGYGDQLDYLIIDLPPGTGDIQLSMAQQVEVTGAIIVTTPQELALADVRRGVALFNLAHVPILGIVENMSGFVCPHCQQSTDLFASGGADRVAGEYGLPVLGAIPLDRNIRHCGDEGLPLVKAQPESTLAQIYCDIARKLVDRVAARAV